MEKKPRYYTYFSIEFGKIGSFISCSIHHVIKHSFYSNPNLIDILVIMIMFLKSCHRRYIGLLRWGGRTNDTRRECSISQVTFSVSHSINCCNIPTCSADRSRIFRYWSLIWEPFITGAPNITSDSTVVRSYAGRDPISG